jgi:two-component system OmpR family sensor kinase
MTRRLSASARVALAVTLVLAIGSLLLTGVGYLLLSRRLAADLDNTLVQESSAFAAALQTTPAQTTAELEEATRNYLSGRAGGSAGSPVILLVRFTDGKVISNSTVALEDAPENTVRIDIEHPMRRFATFTFQDEEYRVASIPLLDEQGQTIATFQAASPTSRIDLVMAALLRTLLIASLLVTIAGASLSAWVARASLGPLHQVAKTTQAITHSSLSQRVTYDGPEDDVGLMVSALNDMLDRLESAFSEQKHFTADASHELRTPLTIIRGHLELMGLEGDLTPLQQESLVLVMDELERMSRLVEDLLALARLDAGAARPFLPIDMAELAEEAVTRVRGLAPRDFAVHSSGKAVVLGDRDMLLQSLLNLLNNAIDATANGGSIVVRCMPAGDSVLVQVLDDGPGIPDSDLPRVFDRFYRARNTRRSAEAGRSGLGLTIAARLAVRHGGSLTAANHQAGGAVFTLALPAHEHLVNGTTDRRIGGPRRWNVQRGHAQTPPEGPKKAKEPLQA